MPFHPLPAHQRADPHPAYHQLRAATPVRPVTEPDTGRRLWLLTRYHDVRHALRHPALCREFTRLRAARAAGHRRARNDLLAGLGLSRHLLNLDPPDHTRLRQLISAAFTTRAVDSLTPRIEAVAERLLDTVDDDAEVDLIEALALPLPVAVIAALLGLPVDDHERFRGWLRDLLDGEDRGGAGNEFLSYLSDQLARRRRAPADDLLSRLVRAERDGDRLRHDELLSCVFLLLVAGHETTVNLIGNGLLALLRHPGQLRWLRRTPPATAAAVEELLRFDGPVEATTLRYALRDLEIGGVPIPRGDAVLPLLLAANRDPAVFPDPDRLWLTRPGQRHLGFGHGSHFCLGAPLARREATVAVTVLLRRFRHLSLATPADQLRWTDRFPLRGLARLPVRLGR